MRYLACLILTLSLSLSLSACGGADRYVTVSFDGVTHACHIISPTRCKVLLHGVYRTIPYRIAD